MSSRDYHLISTATTENVKMSIVENFQKWLNDELNKRGWSQADLARETNMARGSISLIMGQGRSLGLDSVVALSRAFGYSVDFILRRAGYLPAISADDEQEQELVHKFNKLPSEARTDVLDFTRYKSGIHHQKIPLIFDIFERLSHEPRRGILFLVGDPDEVHSIMPADRYRFIQHAQIPGQGWIIEAIDEGEGK